MLLTQEEGEKRIPGWIAGMEYIIVEWVYCSQAVIYIYLHLVIQQNIGWHGNNQSRFNHCEKSNKGQEEHSCKGNTSRIVVYQRQ